MAVFTDNFDGAAGTLLSSRPGWQLGEGYRDVLELDGSGAIRHNGFSGDGKHIVHDVGERRQYLKATLGAGFFAADASVGLTFGYVDMSNNYSVVLYGGALLLRIGGGALAELGTWAAGDILECIFYADIHDIVIKKNGATVGTYSSAAYNWNTSGTKVGVWLSYAGQPATADILRSFEAGTLAAPDTTAPTHTGTVTVTSRSASSIATSCPTATDNVAVTSYDVRIDGGAWIDKGLATSHNFTGLTADTAHTIDWTARDAAGNRSTPPLSVSTSTYPAGAMASTILLLTGPQEGNPAGMLYALAGTVQPGDWLSYYIVSGPTPAGGVLDAQANGAFTYTGPAPATLVIQPQVNGVDVAQITVTLYDATVGLSGNNFAATPAFASGSIAQAAPVLLSGAGFVVVPAIAGGVIVQSASIALQAASFAVTPALAAGSVVEVVQPNFTSMASSPVYAVYLRDRYRVHAFHKAAGEVLDFDIDFRHELRATQDSARAADPVEVEVGAGVEVLGAYWVPSLRRIKLWLSGGAQGGVVDLSVWLNTTAGRRLQADVRVYVK